MTSRTGFEEAEGAQAGGAAASAAHPALDGGGILGAFTAGVLDGLMSRADHEEKQKAKEEGRVPQPVRLLDHVDLITGTSTGGILAIALAMDSSPEQVCEFYKVHGPKIFPKDPLRTRTLLHLLRYKYNSQPLRRAVESVVCNKPLDEACCGLVITSVDVDNGAIRMFKTNHLQANYRVTPDIPAVEAALATSAAPTYFPPHSIAGGVTYVDGGLWANNPAMVGVTEAVAYLGYDLDQLRLLSISTTNVPYNLSRARRVGGLILWAKPAVDAFMRFQIEAAHSMAKSLVARRGGNYLRIDPMLPQGLLTLDNAGMVERLIGMGREIGSYDTHYNFFREVSAEITILAGPGSLRGGPVRPRSGGYPMARTPDPKVHALWRDRIRRQEASGLTIDQFCTREGVARSKFHAWKRRLRLADSAGPGSTLPARSTFLPVTVRLLERVADQPLPIEADLPNGIRLRIPTVNEHLACRLVRAVAAAKTNSGGSR